MNECGKCERPSGRKCCFSCRNDATKCEVWHHCGKDCPEWKPRTNFDRIKAMSVDEMSTFICGIYDNDDDFGKFINGTLIQCYDENSIKEWLESEA